MPARCCCWISCAAACAAAAASRGPILTAVARREPAIEVPADTTALSLFEGCAQDCLTRKHTRIGSRCRQCHATWPVSPVPCARRQLCAQWLSVSKADPYLPVSQSWRQHRPPAGKSKANAHLAMAMPCLRVIAQGSWALVHFLAAGRPVALRAHLPRDWGPGSLNH